MSPRTTRAKLSLLRLFDRQESLCTHLRDSFASLPDVEVLHCELNMAIQGAECLVIPIHTYQHETPLLKALYQLLGESLSQSIASQFKTTFDNELIPFSTSVIPLEPPPSVSSTLRAVVTVAIWTKPFLGEASIEHAFYSVINTINDYPQPFGVVAVPTFFTASVANVLSPKVSAEQLARVYWRFLKATNTPNLKDWSPLKDPLLAALQSGSTATIKIRGITGEGELVRLVNIAAGIEQTNSTAHAMAFKMLNHLLRRDESKLPQHGIWTRAFVLQRIQEMIQTNPRILHELLPYAGLGTFKPYAKLNMATVTKEQALGRGAGGVVWRVTQNGVSYAMKQFTTVIDDQAAEEVRREVALLVLCSHNRIVSCSSAFLQKDDYFYLMDLGRCDLRGMLDKKLLKNDVQRKRIALQVAEGLAFIHKLKLVHRDLKSPNVIIMQGSGVYDDVKIADLGICRPIQNMMTRHAGTLLWLAPEVGRGVYSEKADVYSYGILLWEIMTSGVPYGNSNDFALWDKIVKGLRPTLPKGSSSIPIVKLMTSCWHEKPDKRPSAEEIAAILSGDIAVVELSV
eukprot:TRINITY_DN6046_c0_g1_i1.p1 TRINITY_DN6046_c0_g1~~TRINITY_DN6046_c0_g1_i1.p1  ORF type:complete len:604 (+),score=94.72 TRINITY_DN6046_c0_g1_i1:103-1812(+)